MGSVGHRVGDLQYLLGGAERRRCAQDLASVLDREPGDRQVSNILRRAYRTGTAAALEILALADHPLEAAQLDRHCHVEQEQRLRAELDAGRPVIVLTQHMGNTMIMEAWLASRGYPLSVVYRESNKFPPGFFQRLLSLHGIEGIAANDGARAYRQMLRALRGGRVLCIIMDQGTKFPGGVPVRFLGKDMDMPAGPVQLARQAGASVLPVITLGDEPRWTFRVEPPVDLDPLAPVEDAVRHLTRVMESQVLARPQLWTWHHRRWRRYPLATDEPVIRES